MASFAYIQKQKEALLARVALWPEANLFFRPSPAGWSAVEIFDHLVRTESAILSAARSGLDRPHPIGLSDRARTFLLNSLFRTRARVKAPGAVTQILPAPDLRFAEIRSRWNDERSDLSDFLSSAPADQLRRGIFRHPVGGMMNSSGILDFFSVHMIHHGYQLDRLAAGAKIPEPQRRR